MPKNDYRANAEIWELENDVLKKILNVIIEGETDFDTVKKNDFKIFGCN